ncbi:MAG: glycine zipper 2TM domain-containing protein [Marinobacterium sp.]|nr:glycine zipper 2TM domain-containing protein [Marinobacterium sp.]
MTQSAAAATPAKTSALVISMLTLALIPFEAQASRHRDHHDWAKVTHVEPIYQQIRTRTPRQSCWDEQVRVQHNRYNDSYTDEVLGAVIGGAVGNALGTSSNSKNRRIKTAIGAALGASVGHDIGQRGSRSYRYQTQRRCTVSHDVEYYDEITGYRVSYRYKGRHYHTRMPHHPGKRIRVQVNVQPAY